MEKLVLAVRPDSAEAILDGSRTVDHRAVRPARLPARAYLAVSGTGGVIGECVIGAPERRDKAGWALPVSSPRRYRSPRPLSAFGLAKTPRSFRYLP